MKTNRVDIAICYTYENSLYEGFETTHIFKPMQSYWVIPKRRLLSYVISNTDLVVLNHLNVCTFLVIFCWLICALKKTHFQFMMIVELATFQPVRYMPKVDWLQWLITFCILMLVNVNVVIQSNFRVALTFPKYDQSIKNIYDVAASPYTIVGTKTALKNIVREVNSKTMEALQRKFHFQNNPVTAAQMITDTDHIMFVNSFNFGFLRNPQDALKVDEVSSYFCSLLH